MNADKRQTLLLGGFFALVIAIAAALDFCASQAEEKRAHRPSGISIERAEVLPRVTLNDPRALVAFRVNVHPRPLAVLEEGCGE